MPDSGAQCDPPEPIISACWIQPGGGNWNDPENWDPFGLPLSVTTAYNQIGAFIRVNIGTAPEPVTIADFRYGTLQAQLGVNNDRHMVVTNSIIADPTNPIPPHLLLLSPNASLTVGQVIENVSVSVQSIFQFQTTTLTVGTFRNGGIFIDTDADMFVNNIDQTSPVNPLGTNIIRGNLNVSNSINGDRNWDVEGEATVIGSVVGQGDWIVRGTGKMSVTGSFSAPRLVVEDGAILQTGFMISNPINLFLISDELTVKDADVMQFEGAFRASPGSVFSVSEGSVVVLPDPGVDVLAFGLGANFFQTSSEDLSFRSFTSRLQPFEGPQSQLELVVGGLTGISRIHEEASDWDATGVTLKLVPSSIVASMEAMSPDFGSVWFTDSPCVKSWDSLQIFSGAQGAILVDTFENSRSVVNNETGLPEAIYVGDLNLNGAIVDFNNLNLYS